jgi:hypothetical protein
MSNRSISGIASLRDDVKREAQDAQELIYPSDRGPVQAIS